MLTMMNFMSGERQTRGSRPNVPVFSGSGIAPTYYSGSAVKSDIPYSRSAKLVGFLIAAGLVLLVLWFIWSMIMSASP
jgi:hypothetical protein